MNQRIRQRIVGTVVLLLAAVVILPAVLDGSGLPARDVESSIPAEAPSPEPVAVSPRRPEITADTDRLRLPADSPALDDTGADTEADEQKPALDPASGLPEAWSVRLGAFSNAENVAALVSRLQDASHEAYTRPVGSSGGDLIGVFVGPLVDRDAAVALQGELQSSFGLAGRVERYRIEE